MTRELWGRCARCMEGHPRGAILPKDLPMGEGLSVEEDGAEEGRGTDGAVVRGHELPK